MYSSDRQHADSLLYTIDNDSGSLSLSLRFPQKPIEKCKTMITGQGLSANTTTIQYINVM